MHRDGEVVLSAEPGHVAARVIVRREVEARRLQVLGSNPRTTKHRLQGGHLGVVRLERHCGGRFGRGHRDLHRQCVRRAPCHARSGDVDGRSCRNHLATACRRRASEQQSPERAAEDNDGSEDQGSGACEVFSDGVAHSEQSSLGRELFVHFYKAPRARFRVLGTDNFDRGVTFGFAELCSTPLRTWTEAADERKCETLGSRSSSRLEGAWKVTRFDNDVSVIGRTCCPFRGGRYRSPNLGKNRRNGATTVPKNHAAQLLIEWTACRCRHGDPSLVDTRVAVRTPSFSRSVRVGSRMRAPDGIPSQRASRLTRDEAADTPITTAMTSTMKSSAKLAWVPISNPRNAFTS